MKNSNTTIKTIKLLAILFISALTFTACSDDDHDDDDHDHEEELITTVNYTLTNTTNANDVITLSFVDLDGEGGEDGTYSDAIILSANTTYTGVLQLLNETENPADDITVEVKDEGDEHEFFYSSNITGVSVAKTDTDGDGNPIGIETTLTTGDTGVGTLTIVLKHEPTKPNDGTSDNAGGSTDVDVTFAISVQ